jgi:multidrug resistance protein, MATE family
VSTIIGEKAGRLRGNWREVLNIAWPLMVSMASYTAMGLADVLMVAQLGTTELAAVGLGLVSTFGVLCIGMGMLNGVKVVTAQAIGAGDRYSADRALHQGLFLAVALGLMGLLLEPFALPLMELMGGEGEVAFEAANYLRARLWGVVPTFVGITAFAYFDGQGYTRVSMVVMVIANSVNILLDYLLIFGVGPIAPLGVAGAAWATVIAQCIQGSLGLLLALRHRKENALWPDWRGFGGLLRLGVPMGIRMALEVQAWSVFSALLARVGEVHLAAHIMVVRICSVSFLPGHALGETACILAGQATGAGDMPAAKRAERTTLRLCLAVMGAFALTFVVGRDTLVSFFTSDPELIAVAREVLLVGAAWQIFDAIGMVRAGALNGLGDTRFVMVVSVVCSWAMLPLAWYLATNLDGGAPGAWVALTANLGLLALILTLRWRKRMC